MKKNKISSSCAINCFAILVIILSQISCQRKIDLRNLNSKIDPNINMSYDDYKDKLLPNIKEKNENNDLNEIPPIPQMSPMLISPSLPKLGSEKLVTLSVTDDVPLKDILIELGRVADIDLELDSQITGGIIFKVKNRPFNDVIERICNQANLRYYNNNGILKIERDIPYLENYTVDFLNIVRSSSNTSQLSTSLASTSSGSSSSSSSTSSSSSSGNNGNLGSTSSLKSSYEGDLWLSVENDLKKILNISNGTDSFNRNISNNSNDASTVAKSKDGNEYLSINKQASIISIYASHKLQKQAQNYINKVKKAASAQVLIEAKIIEVDLKDNYQTGINWVELNNKIAKFATGMNFASNIAGTDQKITFARGLKGTTITGSSGILSTNNIQGAVDATQSFGNTRTLASPRIHAMNNQQAVLSFVENQVYFTLAITNTPSSTSSTGTTGGQVTLTSTANSIPIGVIVALQPSINLDTDEIIMNIRPTITSSETSVADPAVAYIIAQSGLTTSGLTNSVPIVNIKEIDSILKIKTGQVMVIGGMMQETSKNSDSGVPFLMSIPFIGNLFKSTNRSNSLTETVIFIKATIMHPENVLPNYKDFYNNFARNKELI